MYAYVDETGNTGGNLFDDSQPFFTTAALLTREDFDSDPSNRVKQIANKCGLDSLHANKLNPQLLAKIASSLLDALKQCNARFFASRVEKRYVATAKLVDYLFDPVENPAVPYFWYNHRMMRLALVHSIASILPEETARMFWSCLLDSSKRRAQVGFVESLIELQKNINLAPDNRFQQVATEAIQWMIDHSNESRIHLASRATRKGHFPNMVAFPILLAGITETSKYWNQAVIEIVHDRQSQFQSVLKEWHRLMSEAGPGTFTFPGEEPFEIRQVPGSTFRVSDSTSSAGIQVIDFVLWHIKRVQDKRPISDESAQLLQYVFAHGAISDLSFHVTGMWLATEYDRLFSGLLTADEQSSASQFLLEQEQRRRAKLIEYEQKKISDATRALDRGLAGDAVD